MIKQIQTFGSLLLLGFLTTLVVLQYSGLSAERSRKKAKEIERVETHNSTKEPCEQYALIAAEDGWYPCYNCGQAKIYLKAGEVWKYGKTCNGKQGRYKSGLPFDNLIYAREFVGSEKECLIEEKNKIYNYPNLPECQNRGHFLERPPGNKIDR